MYNINVTVSTDKDAMRVAQDIASVIENALGIQVKVSIHDNREKRLFEQTRQEQIMQKLEPAFKPTRYG